MKSVFTEKEKEPRPAELKKALGKSFEFWQSLVSFTKAAYPIATEKWNYPGYKYGWSFRISDKKRVLIYLLPRDNYFKVAFVFGQKAYDQILKSDISKGILIELKNAKKYAEGRGLRIEVRDHAILKDIQKLIEIKISN